MTYLLIFILSVFLSAPYLIDICSGYLNYQSFDIQEFLLWHYTSINNVIPYKDIFYPYGLLDYFKNYNLIYIFIYYLIVPFLFTITFFIFRKIFKGKFILYSSFAIFYLFILILVGFQTFSRYGLLVVLSLYFSHIFYSSRKIKTNTLIFLGIILGLVCSFIIDQGIYLILSFIFIYLLSRRFKIKEILYLISGFFVGIIPFLLFFLRIGNLDIFIIFFKDVSEIVTVAKTPFFSFINSPANVFTISILYIAIFYNFIKIFLFKRELTLSSFFQIALIFSILIMEQKSIMRSIDRQITFASLILLMFLVYETINYLKNKVLRKRIIYFSILFFVIIAYGFNIPRQQLNFPNLFKNYNLLINNKCFDNNLDYFSANNPSYRKIVDLIKNQTNFNGKIFSFPIGDSAFYILLKQKPPFYNSIFEGSSYGKQKYTIKYIQGNEVEFITLNTDISSLQDGVPDYIRQSFLFKHILNNYYPFEAIGNHIVLKKEKDKDFFASETLGKIKNYRNYLSEVDLKKIPYSEGLYKYDFLTKNNKLLIKTTNIAEINSLLVAENFYSTNKVFVLSPNIDYEKGYSGYIKLVINDENNSTIYYDPCNKNLKCIVNLANIPLFYRERVIVKIILDETFKGNIEIYDLVNSGSLW